jgi:hypothetical protein
MVTGAAADERSPFVPAPVVAASVAAAGSGILDRFELSGVTRIGDLVQLCLVEAPSQKARWLTLGMADDGLTATRYDAEKCAVLMRMGDEERWIAMRRGAVAELPLVRRDDGTIDYTHMALTDRQKEKKAAMQHWELMEVSRLGRVNAAPAPRAPATPAISPVR